MLKLLLLLGCINLLVIASTNVFENTAGTHEKSSINAKLGMNKTDSNSRVPLMFAETQSGQVINVGTGNNFACPDGYTYLSFNDDVSNLLDVCRALAGKGTNFRLQGGGYATSPSIATELTTDLNRTYRCDSEEAGTVALDKALCVKTEIVDHTLTKGDAPCPDGFDLITVEETNSNKADLCKGLDNLGRYRIAYSGSLAGPGYNCEEKDWDDKTSGGSLCVKRKIIDVKAIDYAEEALCGKGKRPITAQEALANRMKICNVLNDWDIVRISGGGSFDGPKYGCGVRDIDRRGLGGVLCIDESTA